MAIVREDVVKLNFEVGDKALGKVDQGITNLVKSAGQMSLKVGKFAAKAIATSTAAGIAGLAALGTQAMNTYAEYEQLIGGVETLFKSNSTEVVKYANDAYKTAGLSANEYMSTVTSFSASLLQSLGGDTEKAADAGNRAVIAMADNANKMGTDISSIQDAYQGFAKQNFTMLDNLKLGYGGTKSEMERLLADAQKITGIKYDVSNFADVVEAIQVIQTEMGITGTTAKEASTTIQGSALAMKAAWTNFLGGMVDPTQDFDQLVNNLVDSVVTFAKNIIPKIRQLTPRLVRGLTEITKGVGAELPGMLFEIAPDLISGGVELVRSLFGAIKENAGMFKNAGLEIIKAIYKGITGQEMPTEMFDKIKSGIDGVVESVQKIVSALADSALQIWNGFKPVLEWLVAATVVAFTWIGDNANWLIPILEGLLGAFLAFKALQKVKGIVSGFMGLFGKGGGAAAGGGAGGGGVLGAFNAKNVATALGGIATAIGGIGLIIAAFAALKQIPGYDEFMADGGAALKQLCGIIAEIGPVGAAFVAFTAVAGKHTSITKAATGIGAVAIALGGMEAIVLAFGALSQIEGFNDLITAGGAALQQLCGIIEDIALVGGAFLGFVAIAGTFTNPATVLSGLGAIATALGGMEAVVLAFGALAQIPGLTEFMTSGGELLTELCGIIGEMAGSIVGGFAEGVTNSLPAIGENLSAFATSIQPMFDTFAGVNADGLKSFAVALAALIGVLVGEKLVSMITGSIDYAGLGTNLNTMATNLSGFFTTIMTFPDEGFAKATALFNCLAGISSMPSEGGVVGWFQGEVDYAKMATGLNHLAGTTGFFTAILTIPDEAFGKASKLFECLNSIGLLPNSGGIAQWFTGTVNYQSIASGVQTLASEGMISALTAISAIPATAYTGLTAMFNALAGITALPSEGGIFQWFTGDKTSGLTAVASQLPGVAENIAAFFTNIGGRTDFSAITNLFNAISDINIDASSADKGIFGLGTSDFESIGSGLSSFANNAADFFAAVQNNPPEAITAFINTLGEMSGLTDKLSGLDAAVGTALSAIVTTVETNLTTLTTKITDGMNDIVTAVDAVDLYDSGVNMMNGLKNGILSKRASLITTAQGIANTIKKTIDRALDIHSPSRVMFDTGVFTGQGMQLGMQSTIPDIRAAADEMGHTAIPYGGSYSPEGSATYYNGDSSEVTTISPVFNLTVTGTSDDRAMARRVKRFVEEAIAETFASMERKNRVIREV